MSGTYHKLIIDTAARYPTSTSVPTCVAAPVAAFTYASALPQCRYRESGGVQCEREHKHEGGHAMPDALFSYLQARWDLQGPICRVRRGPPEYIYEEGPMCL